MGLIESQINEYKERHTDQTQNAHVNPSQTHTRNDDYDILVLLKTVILGCLVLAAVVFLYFTSSHNVPKMAARRQCNSDTLSTSAAIETNVNYSTMNVVLYTNAVDLYHINK